MNRPHALSLLALATLSACSLFTSLGELSENEPVADGGGGGSNDGNASTNDGGGGGGDLDASTSDGDAGGGYPNLHPNGTMEFGCQGWYPYNATLEGSSTAHGGSGSCMVCADKTVDDTATIDEFGATLDPILGGNYVATVWLRMVDGKLPPSSGVTLAFGTRDANGADVEIKYSAPLAMDATWKKLEVQLVPTKPAKKLRIYAGGRAEIGKCFLIDDIRIELRQ